MTANAAKVARELRKQFQPSPVVHGPWQWGYVVAVHASNNTVDLYLDGTQNFGSADYLTPGVRYGQWYTPVVNDVVLVARGLGGNKTDRLVLGRPAVPPFNLWLGNDTQQATNSLWGGSGVPPSTLGADGDYYFRSDTPGTQYQRIYVKSAGSWIGTPA